MTRATKRLIVIMIIFFLAVAGIYLGIAAYYSGRFFPGSYINGEDCSGMTVAEVEEHIADQVEDYSIEIQERGGATETIDGSAINFSYAPDGTVQELKDAQNPLNWMYAFFHPETHSMTAQTTYDEEFLRTAMEKLNCLQDENITQPEDAYIKEVGTDYELVPEVQGNLLDKDKVFEALKTAVDQGQRTLNLETAGCYIDPAVTSDDETLNRKYNNLKKYANMTITYQIGDEREVLDAATIKSWMSVSENGDISFSEEHIADWIAGLAEKYDTFGKDVSFNTSLGQTITVNSLDYGWQMDQEGEKSKLKSYLDAGESVLTEPLWLKMGASLGGNGIGSTYVEIDYTNQRMWFYKDGSLLVDSLVVTGNVSRDMASPEGIFGLYYKETNATLEGEDYKTPVDFWMPFYGGVGIHDAKWRSNFGGTLYQTEGSHGCINTPWENAKTIFENIEAGTPIVCYSSGNNLGQGAQAYSQPAETRNVEEEEQQAASESQAASTEAATSAPETSGWEESTGSYESSGDGSVIVIN